MDSPEPVSFIIRRLRTKSFSRREIIANIDIIVSLTSRAPQTSRRYEEARAEPAAEIRLKLKV
jgi:hypothetical protein